MLVHEFPVKLYDYSHVSAFVGYTQGYNHVSAFIDYTKDKVVHQKIHITFERWIQITICEGLFTFKHCTMLIVEA